MEFGEIFSDALKYPISDYKKLLTLGLVFLISSLPSVFATIGLRNGSINMSWTIVSFAITLLTWGYGLSVVRESITLNDEIPDFDWVKNFVDGIKRFLVMFIYFLIPTIVVFVLGILSIASFGSFISDSTLAAVQSASTPEVAIAAIPSEAWGALGIGLVITLLVGIILYLIFALFETVAACRLAKYDSFGEAFAVGQIWQEIKQIGILRLIAFLIVLGIVGFIITLLIGLISIIPFVGPILGALFGSSFLALFGSRAMGLLYSDVE